jgi:serine/threonine protein phosphatase 1
MRSRNFFGRAATPSGPRRHRAYAIGDVHGCSELLDRLLSAIEADIATRPQKKISIVFLGDLIDRGLGSAQVLERLRTYSPDGAAVHFVMGNHEEVMLRVLEGDIDLLTSWLRFGGAETLRSYGLDSSELTTQSKEDLIGRIRQAIPAEHQEFLDGFADSISFGDYLFVHAGIRPGIALSEQSQEDLRWIREPFLQDESDHGSIVVHGHTITNQVEFTANRIGIDTGAYSTGTLSALAIDGRERWLIQASPQGTERVSVEE